MHRLALALCFTVAVATPAQAGPPWLTLEFRPNEYAVLVRTIHHGGPVALPLTGTAEGLVNGQRRSVPLTFVLAEKPNVYSVPNSWGAEGVWVLNISATGDRLGAGAVIGFDRNGAVAFTRFPRTMANATRPATTREVEAMLRALDANAVPAGLGRPWSEIALRVVLPMLMLFTLVLGVARIGAGINARVRRRSAVRATA